MGDTSAAASDLNQTLKEGLLVCDADGQRLGRVAAVGDGWLLVEQGFWRPREAELSFADVVLVAPDEVRVAAERVRWRRAGLFGAGPLDGEERGPEERIELRPGGEGLTVPVVAEEAEVVRRVRQGAVRIRREVVTELRQITIPVRREVLRVEHVDRLRPGEEPLEEEHAPPAAEDEQFLDLHEDFITVTTRPMVRERVRIRRTRTSEERQVSLPLRSQSVEVERVEAHGAGPLDDGSHAR